MKTTLSQAPHITAETAGCWERTQEDGLTTSLALWFLLNAALMALLKGCLNGFTTHLSQAFNK